MQAVQDTLGKPLVVVAYERLLADTRREIRRVAGGLAMMSRLVKDEVIYYQHQFIDASLRHAKCSGGELVRMAKVLPVALDAYDLLNQRATDEIGDAEFRPRWDALPARYKVEYPAFVVANSWLGDRRAISVADLHRTYLRISYHGSAEIWRLTKRAIGKVCLET